EELAIDLEGLASEDGVMIKRVLLYALERITSHRKDIGVCHIRSLLELMEKDGSKELFLPNGVRACKEYQILFLKRTEHDKENVPSGGGIVTIPEILLPGIPVEVNVPDANGFTFILWEAGSLPETSLFYKKEQNIPENRYTKWFDYDKITTSLLLRTRQEGDYLTVDDALHTQSVKRYMVNEKIPKMKRSSMYMLADGSHILWIPGYRISTHYKVGKSTKRIMEVRLRGGNDGGTNRGIVVGERG
ncbi:MAG: tRNA lysidine(34) synthetase TilS, partial [Lachnospiraceae bacterium]|nr:tRNA lysidine(34) synthetase TilS [Lachnospiraceae bacterium]